MKTAQDIILRPVITEASMANVHMGKYTFVVDKRANKIEIAKAVETLFPGTKVSKVNTMNVLGKKKRMGTNVGYRPNWKKAIVTLDPAGKGIAFFESMV